MKERGAGGQGNVAFVDDHTLLQATLLGSLEEHFELTVFAFSTTAQLGNEGVIGSIIERRPDVIILQINVAGTICFEAARTFRQHLPDTGILFLSAIVNSFYVTRALNVGALGFLSRDEPVERIADAIHTVRSKNTAFSNNVLPLLEPDDASGERRPRSPLTSLSPRELEVLLWVTQGLTNKEIARHAHVTQKTIDKHVENIMEKTGVHDRVGLARLAIREELAEA